MSGQLLPPWRFGAPDDNYLTIVSVRVNLCPVRKHLTVFHHPATQALCALFFDLYPCVKPDDGLLEKLPIDSISVSLLTWAPNPADTMAIIHIWGRLRFVFLCNYTRGQIVTFKMTVTFPRLRNLKCNPVTLAWWVVSGRACFSAITKMTFTQWNYCFWLHNTALPWMYHFQCQLAPTNTDLFCVCSTDNIMHKKI